MVSALLAMMALLAPGTGVLEFIALAGLVTAGYFALQLNVNSWALIVLICSAIPFYFYAWKGKGRAYLAAALALFLIGTAYLFNQQGWLPVVDPLLVLIVSVLVGFVLWIVSIKTRSAMRRKPVQDIEGLPGTEGETRTEIHHEGSIYVAGELWSARSRNPIRKGQRVRILQREGLILEVEEIE